MKELELYIHIPFCVEKCLYCDFLSAPPHSNEAELYLHVLQQEIRQKAPRFQSFQVVSIFIGGGTPSMLPGELIGELLDCVRKYFSVEGNAEITIECNPGTLDEKKLQAYKSAGINRLSVGLQSSNDILLKKLGRIHTYSQFLNNFYTARDLGFYNINVDLMYGLPYQTSGTLRATLEDVVRLEPEHLSVYGLILEEGTPFYEIYGDDAKRRERGEVPSFLPSEYEETQMDRIIRAVLDDAGYKRYEISNYARAGQFCRHNIGYWTGVEYLGLGLGASSYLRTGNTYVRSRNCTGLHRYLRGHVYAEEEQTLTLENRIEEFMFLGLRMTEGISRRAFAARFGRQIEEVYGPVLNKLYGRELLAHYGDRILLTGRGMDVSNVVLSEFLL